jgi:hypothetical protein
LAVCRGCGTDTECVFSKKCGAIAAPEVALTSKEI